MEGHAHKNMDYPIETLKERFFKIPPEVQEAISSVAVADTLTEIGKKHRLHLDEINSLVNIAGEVMLGMTTPQNFRGRLGEELPLTKDVLDLIVVEVDEQIFRPIKESLMKIYDKKEETAEDHAKMSPHEILHGIENPWRMTYKTEPIEMELPVPSLQNPQKPLVMAEVPKPTAANPVFIRKEVVPAPKMPATEPPRSSLVPEKPLADLQIHKPESITPETLAELPPSLRPARINPSSQNPLTPPKPAALPEQKPKVPAEPPSNLPTKEMNPEMKAVKTESPAQKPQKTRTDPYREPV